MSKKIIPTVPIVLDRPRELFVDFNATAWIEAKTGRSCLDPATFSKPTMKHLRMLLTAALRHEDPDITEKQVGKHINMGNMSQMFEAVRLAWTTQVSSDEPAEGSAPPLQTAVV